MALPDGYRIDRYSKPQVIIEARSTAETEPAAMLPTGRSEKVRVYVHYDGTVSSCTVTSWVHENDRWYEGQDTSLAPLSGDADEVRDFDVRPGTTVGFTISAISGGGTAEVLLEQV